MLKVLIRLALLPAAAFLALASGVMAQGAGVAAPSPSTADPEKPVTPPDSYRVVMENERVRIIEIHIRPHSKVNVDSAGGRDRFLYMLSDGALILAPPGKTPYEFALHAGETAVFPPVSPTVENDTDAPVRALMVEVKEGMRTASVGGKKGKYASRRSASGKSATRASRSAGKAAPTRSRTKAAQTAKPSKPATANSGVNAPLNLKKANAKPARRATGKSRASDG